MKFRPIATYLITLLLIVGPPMAWAELTMGVFPRRPVAVTHQTFKPLAEHLSQQLGEEVRLVVPKNFKAFWQGVVKNEYDLVHYNQLHYIKSHKAFGYRVLVANEEFGSRRITGALTVRKDSGIKSLDDLKGKTLLFGGGKKAMASYIAPTAILKRHGLIAGRDYTEKFAKNPPSATIGIFHKAADAAGTGNVVIKIAAVTKKIDTTQLHILAESESFVHLPWAVNALVPEEKAAKIASVMTSLPKGDDVLKAARVTGFFPVTDANFNKVREMVSFVEGK